MYISETGFTDKDIKIPDGRCLICEQRKKMWRCVDLIGNGAALHGVCFDCRDKYVQQSVHLTALLRGLAVSILFNVVLLAVALFTIGGR